MEGVINNKWKDNMTEITEIGEVIWELHANRAITDIEQKTESHTIKDLIGCFDIKDAGKKSNKFSNSFDNVRICIQTWADKKKYIIEAMNFIDDKESNEKFKSLNVDDLIGHLLFSINSRMPKECRDWREWYKSEIGKESEMSCNLCDTGLHGCNKKYYDMGVPGLVWLCYECLDKLGKHEIIFAFNLLSTKA